MTFTVSSEAPDEGRCAKQLQAPKASIAAADSNLFVMGICPLASFEKHAHLHRRGRWNVLISKGLRGVEVRRMRHSVARASDRLTGLRRAHLVSLGAFT